MSETRRQIAFRADGGVDIGMGHLVRCLALAEGLRDSAEIYFFTASDPEPIRRFLAADWIHYVRIDPQERPELEIPQLQEHFEKQKIDTLITDSYRFDESYLQRFRDLGYVVVSVDDNSLLSYPSHLVLNGNIYAEELEYKSGHDDTQYLLGPKYTFVRREFSQFKSLRPLAQRCGNLLVSFGGCQTKALLQQVFSHLRDLEFVERILLLPGLLSKAEIVELKEAFAANFEIEAYDQSQPMAPFMDRADLALSAAGSTIYELCALGVPSVLVVSADNQQNNARCMRERDILPAFGSIQSLDWQEVLKTLNSLADDFGWRQSMCQNMLELIDGQGARRCAEAILSTHA